MFPRCLAGCNNSLDDRDNFHRRLEKPWHERTTIISGRRGRTYIVLFDYWVKTGFVSWVQEFLIAYLDNRESEFNLDNQFPWRNGSQGSHFKNWLRPRSSRASLHQNLSCQLPSLHVRFSNFPLRNFLEYKPRDTPTTIKLRFKIRIGLPSTNIPYGYGNVRFLKKYLIYDYFRKQLHTFG